MNFHDVGSFKSGASSLGKVQTVVIRADTRGAHANGTVLEFLWTELGQYSIFDVEQIDIGNWKISFEKIISKLIVECKIANENWDDREVV